MLKLKSKSVPLGDNVLHFSGSSDKKSDNSEQRVPFDWLYMIKNSALVRKQVVNNLVIKPTVLYRFPDLTYNQIILGAWNRGSREDATEGRSWNVDTKTERWTGEKKLFEKPINKIELRNAESFDDQTMDPSGFCVCGKPQKCLSTYPTCFTNIGPI